MSLSAGMESSFVAERFSAAGPVTSHLLGSNPGNPFCTREYLEGMQRLGYEVWVLDYGQDLNGNCAVFIKTGRLNRLCEIHSLPAIANCREFWKQILAFARHKRITQVEAQSFGSPSISVPTGIRGECARRAREEYILDLCSDWEGRLSTNHKRNIRKAKKSGLSVEIGSGAPALATHARLMRESMLRRLNRGENVDVDVGLELVSALVNSGAGVLFQCFRANEPLSSVLVLRSACGAYYQSAGTSAEGMAVGASHYLIYEIAESLRRDGFLHFNLGGAPANSSLALFKNGFGASPVSSHAVSVYTGSLWKRKLTTLINTGREDPRKVVNLLLPILPSFQRWIIYSRSTAEPLARFGLEGVDFCHIGESELRNLDVKDDAFQQRQLQRLERCGRSFAYAVRIGGKIGHISWLLPADIARRESPRVLKFADDEAEITSCETLDEFRGKRLYPFAIGELIELARAQGVRRIYMKTIAKNRASQAGIVRAGLKRAGSAIVIKLPLLSPRCWRF